MTPARFTELASAVREAQELAAKLHSAAVAFRDADRWSDVCDARRDEYSEAACNFDSASRQWPAIMAELLAEAEAGRAALARERFCDEHKLSVTAAIDALMAEWERRNG